MPWVWAPIGKICPVDQLKPKLVLFTVRLLNAQYKFQEAFEYASILDSAFSLVLGDLFFCLVRKERALTAAGMGNRQAARDAFAESLAMWSVQYGLWHPHTLDTLYHFGRLLREWGDANTARSVLGECCRGVFFRFGPSRPTSQRAYAELELCSADNAISQELRVLFEVDPVYAKRRISLAYEYLHLKTIVDILRHVPSIDYAQLEVSLHGLPFWDIYQRVRMRCKQELGLFSEALALSRFHDNLIKVMGQYQFMSRYHPDLGTRKQSRRSESNVSRFESTPNLGTSPGAT
jgi:hypothetical protein